MICLSVRVAFLGVELGFVAIWGGVVKDGESLWV